MGTNEQQVQYWNTMTELRTHLDYLHVYHDAMERSARYVNALVSLTSSASIAAWAIWQVVPYVWAALVALAQVATTVAPQAVWRNLITATRRAAEDLQVLFLQAERDWYGVSQGERSEPEIHELRMNIKDRSAQISTSHFRDAPLPERKRHLDSAKSRAATYFGQNYQLQGER